MNRTYNKLKDIESIRKFHNDILTEIYKEIYKIVKGKREIMFSDVINFIIRNQYQGEIYNQIIIWCNYNIKRGKYIFNLLPNNYAR